MLIMQGIAGPADSYTTAVDALTQTSTSGQAVADQTHINVATQYLMTAAKASTAAKQAYSQGKCDAASIKTAAEYVDKASSELNQVVATSGWQYTYAVNEKQRIYNEYSAIRNCTVTASTPPAPPVVVSSGNLTLGTDFKYSVLSYVGLTDSVKSIFKNLQAQVNRVGPSFGIASLGTPDGAIGPGTTKAIVSLATKFTANGGGAAAYKEVLAASDQKLAVAQRAARILGDLTKLVVTPAKTTTTGTSTTVVTRTDDSTVVKSQDTIYPQESSSNFWWYVGGVAAAGIIGVGAYYAFRKKPEESSDTAMMPAMAGWR